MTDKYDKQKFQTMIIKLDPQCMCFDCKNESVSGHHIIYKSQWSDRLRNALGFDRDSNQNSIGLCAVHHYQCHNGLGIGKISGREFMYEILNDYGKNTGYYYRWLKVKQELEKSIGRKKL